MSDELIEVDRRDYNFNYVIYGDKPNGQGVSPDREGLSAEPASAVYKPRRLTTTGDATASRASLRQKPVVLFLHGFMGNCHDFLAVIDRLNKFCCLVVDLPGHGKTEVKCDRNYQMPNTALALIQLLQELNIKQCLLVGYSMGGRLALYLTVYFPQFFTGVILESASPGLKTQQMRDRRIEQDYKLAKRLESQDFDLFLQQWYSNPLFASFVRHPNYDTAIASRLNNNPYKLAKSLRFMGLGVQPSLWNDLPSIKIPLLLLVGSLDPKFVAINRDASLSPSAKLCIVEGVGHNIHFERPAELVRLIKSLAC